MSPRKEPFSIVPMAIRNDPLEIDHSKVYRLRVNTMNVLTTNQAETSPRHEIFGANDIRPRATAKAGEARWYPSMNHEICHAERRWSKGGKTAGNGHVSRVDRDSNEDNRGLRVVFQI
jgi:hypothetical protein